MSASHVRTPLSAPDIEKLKVGEILYLSGEILTLRDQGHLRAINYHKTGKALPVDFKDSVIFHAGPIAKRENNTWTILSLGPTTSMRLEHLEPLFLDIFKPKMIIGKGGMGPNTLEALKRNLAVYCLFPGGAGVLGAMAVKQVIDVKWLDLGIPEALWVLKVEKLGPLIVTMDAHGRTIHK